MSDQQFDTSSKMTLWIRQFTIFDESRLSLRGATVNGERTGRWRIATKLEIVSAKRGGGVGERREGGCFGRVI